MDTPIVKHYAGSIAYGTNLPTSDVDFRGIFCAPKSRIVTPFNPIREKTDVTEEDTKYFELSNYMKMYTLANPNILESLWVDDKHIVETSDVYSYLRGFREDLLSKKVAFTFSGYAFEQMKRIKGHNKWINNPQEEAAPVRANYLKLVHNFREEKILKFDLETWNRDHMLIPYGNDIYGVVYNPGSHLVNRDGGIKKYEYGLIDLELKKRTPEFIVKLCEDEYRSDKETHKNYWRWKNNRNETRSELEEKFGYDTKHAMHVVRLLRMGEEVLETGKVNVFRSDAQELLDIRAGKWTYEEILEYATDQDAKVKGLYKTSSLRKAPDLELATKVLITAQDEIWRPESYERSSDTDR